jgi:competence protein ComEC
MARALVLGENDLSEADDEAFKRSGLAHLLAVSGTHLVFAVLSLVQALRFLLVRCEVLAARWDVGRIAAAVGIVLALLYADFSGGTGSAWRAAWMLAAAFSARAIGRRPHGVRAFALSLWVGAIVDPLALWDLSFLLSAAATSGLLWAQRWAPRLRAIRFAPARYLAGSVAATTAAMVPCSPLLALMSPELTLASVAANVVAAPIGEMAALPLCLAHSVVGFWASLEAGMAVVGSGALLVVRAVAHFSAAATWSALPVPAPTPWHWAVLAVGIAAALVRARGTRANVWLLALAIALVGIEAGAWRSGEPRGVLRVTLTDVGQGDALLVDLPDGTLMLIDGGGFVGSPVDPGVTLRAVLRARRRSRVDIAVLSHPHPDHFLGLSTVLEHVEVGELWDSGQGEREGAHPVYRDMLQSLRRRGVPIRRPAELCEAPRSHGGARLELLGPCPEIVPGRPANDNSMVLRISFGRHVALLTGDAEREQESELVERYGEQGLRADLLKVGHHGSRTSSTTPFLRAVRPSVAIISCGVRNRFGHPHPQAMQRLQAVGATVLRADNLGSIVWRSDGQHISLGTFEELR